jgi:DNA-binding LytR/AlgR family response regulator
MKENKEKKQVLHPATDVKYAFFVKPLGNDFYNKLDYADIICIEARDNQSTIHTTGEDVEVGKTLMRFEKVLPSDIFIRVNRSLIINKNYVDSYYGNTLFLIGYKGNVIVSENRHDEVFSNFIELK